MLRASPVAAAAASSSPVLGVVEQAVGEVVGGGVLAQADDRGGEPRTGSRVGFGGGEAGAARSRSVPVN
jgi:hypothetical protein